METTEKHGHLTSGLGAKGVLLSPKDICDNVQRQKTKDHDSINCLLVGYFGLQQIAELSDVEGHAVNERVKVAVLKTLNEVVPGRCSTVIVDKTKCRLDSFPGAHARIEACLDGRFCVDSLHCGLIDRVNLVRGNNHQPTIFAK